MKREMNREAALKMAAVAHGKTLLASRNLRVRGYLLCIGGMAGILLTAPLQAQEAAMVTSPVGPATAALQYATLTGGENNILVSRVPVVKANKQVVYEDITLALDFSVDAGGTLTVLATPTAVQSPNLITSGFRGGNYSAPATILSGTGLITVNGPGVTTGGATEWNLTTPSGANGCTYPQTATWYVGPLASNPLAPRLQAAKITSTAYSYGVGDSGCYWHGNALLGLSQIGNTITIALFTDGYGNDSNTPFDSITYTLVP